MFPLQKRVRQGLPKAGREERTRRREGGREGPTSNPQPGAKATSTHCRLQLHTP